MVNSETEITVTASGYHPTSLLGATFANLWILSTLNEIIYDVSKTDVLDEDFTAIMVGDGNGNFRYSYRLQRPGKISVFVQEFEQNAQYVWFGDSKFLSHVENNQNSSDLNYNWAGGAICNSLNESLSMRIFFWLRPPSTGTYEFDFSASSAIGSTSKFFLRDIPSVLISKSSFFSPFITLFLLNFFLRIFGSSFSWPKWRLHVLRKNRLFSRFFYRCQS